MISQPLPHLRMLVVAIVVENGVDHLAGRDRSLDGVEKADELLILSAKSEVLEFATVWAAAIAVSEQCNLERNGAHLA